MDVSVIVVNWNTRDFLRQCLRSVYAHTRDVSFEVIVVDNASEDGSPHMVRSECPKVTLIQNDRNRGFAAANNQAIRRARGKYVLLLNSDTRVLDGAIDRTFAFAEGHPEAAVIGCKVHDLRDNAVQFTCHQYPSPLNLLLSVSGASRLAPKSRFLGRQMMAWWGYNEVREVDTIAGCFMFVRQDAIRQVGMLDEQYFMYVEDIDWCFRFREAGWKVVFYPDAEIDHFTGRSSKMANRNMEIERRKSLLMFFAKHRGPRVAALANGLFVINELVRLGSWGGAWACNVVRGASSARQREKLASGCSRLRFHLLAVATNRRAAAAGKG